MQENKYFLLLEVFYKFNSGETNVGQTFYTNTFLYRIFIFNGQAIKYLRFSG